MSLTSEVYGGRSEFLSILCRTLPTKDKFKCMSGHTPFTAEMACLVPYRLSGRQQAATIGIAFDYVSKVIVAQYACQDAQDFLNNFMAYKEYMHLIEFMELSGLYYLDDIYRRSMTRIKNYLMSRCKVSDIIEPCIFFARMEIVLRDQHSIVEGTILFTEDMTMEMKTELALMAGLFTERFVKTLRLDKYSTILNNPAFGVCSSAIGGAVADIYVNGTLYDIKTSKGYDFSEREFAQVYGYAILDSIMPDIGADYSITQYFGGIRNIALYKARFGEIVYAPICITDSIKKEVRQCLKL